MATSETTNRKLGRFYRNRDGEITKRLSPDVVAVILEPIGGSDRVTAELSVLFHDKQLPAPSMALAAMAFGLNTVLGNAIAGKDGEPSQLAAMVQERWESIEDGEWSEGREGGPALKYVLEAWAAYRTQRKGEPTSADQIASMRKHILSGEEVNGQVITKKALLDNDGVQAHYHAQHAARIADKAKAASVRAEAKPASDDPLLAI